MSEIIIQTGMFIQFFYVTRPFRTSVFMALNIFLLLVALINVSSSAKNPSLRSDFNSHKFLKLLLFLISLSRDTPCKGQVLQVLLFRGASKRIQQSLLGTFLQFSARFSRCLIGPSREIIISFCRTSFMLAYGYITLKDRFQCDHRN